MGGVVFQCSVHLLTVFRKLFNSSLLVGNLNMNVVRLIKGVQWMTRKEETFNTLIIVKDAKIWLLTNVPTYLGRQRTRQLQPWQIMIDHNRWCPGSGKGAPGSEYRTYTRLVSPAKGQEKKKRNPLILDKIRHLELTYTLYKYQKKIITHWLITKIPKYHLNKGKFKFPCNLFSKWLPMRKGGESCVDLRTIECQQPGCETQWVHSTVEKKYDLHII